MSVIRFIRHVRKLFPASQDQPLLVHCSAGVGRTGTFITLDMMMQQMRAEDTLSVCQCVRNLRTQRMKMVQSQVQLYPKCHIHHHWRAGASRSTGTIFLYNIGEATYRIFFNLGETAEAHAHSPEIYRRRSFFTLLMVLYTANTESVDGTTPSTVSYTARKSLDMSGSARPPAGYHALMLAVNAFMPPAVNVFMQAVSTRSCVGKRCIVSALTRCVANINQGNRRFLRLSSVGSLPLAKNALHCTSIFKHVKVQYEFIHYALSELVVCGETEMTASRLRSFMDSVRDPGDTSGITYIRNRLRVYLNTTAAVP